jgi:acetylornithine/N-succinyldiaminopimelate aminotransferase
MGRTGKLFAHEWAGITPDIMLVAKGIGGGYPLGALLATEDAARGMTAGTHGSTYGGNPLGCAVGAAVMDEVTREGFLDDVNRKAGFLRQRLEALVGAHPDIFDSVRGSGLMLGLVLQTNRHGCRRRRLRGGRSHGPCGRQRRAHPARAHHHRG